MSKNSIYTYDYFQPPEYHFSLDSVFLAQKVAESLKSQEGIENWRMLDVCAGCGIIGLELSLHLERRATFDFLEVQEIYRSYFNQNVEMIYGKSGHEKMQFLNMNYQDLLATTFQEQYDLIVANPPYFFQGEGLLSPSDFKNRCRFFIDSDFKTLIAAILHTIKPGRSAYLLVRSGLPHGRKPLEEIQSEISGRASAFVFDKIRGTDVIEIRKKAIEVLF